jgi:NAD(P)H-nitrite reductase large subunit
MAICQRQDVSKKKLKTAIRKGHKSVEQLSVHARAGNHCGERLPRIEDMLKKERKRRRSFFGLLLRRK